MKKQKSIDAQWSAGKFIGKLFCVGGVCLYLLTTLINILACLELEKFLLIWNCLIGILSATITFIFINCNIKKCVKSEKDMLKRNMVIVPIIIAVILIVYGMYSVNLSINIIKDEYSKNFDVDDLIFKEQINRMKNQGYTYWISTSVVALIGMETAVFLKIRKIYDKLRIDM